MEFSAQQLADMLRGSVEGNPEAKVCDFAKIEEGREGALSFLANPKYIDYIYTTKSSVVLVAESLKLHAPVSATLIRVKDPYQAVAQLMRLADQILSPKRCGIDPTSIIAKSAKIGEKVYVGPYAVIDEGAVIGDGCQIYPHVYVGQGVKMGNDCTLYAGAVIYKGCQIGNRCTLHATAVVGSDGFGFAPEPDGSYSKIPQMGIVRLGDDVEIGASATVDRSTMGATEIHNGVKLDNLVHIAHNVVVDENTVMAALTGIAGSTKIGKNCMFGGQSGVVGHVEVADRTTLAAKCGVSSSIKEPGKQWHFYPHIEASKFRRSYVGIKQLPDIIATLSETEKKLREALERIEKLEQGSK